MLFRSRNQFVWVPVNDTSRIYERNTTTGKIKAKLWGFEATGRTARSNGNIDTKEEAGVLNNPYNASQDYDRIKYFSGNYNITGYTKDTFYKEFETEYMNTIKSIEKYGGFYIGRYETGSISSNIPIVRRMNQDIGGQNWYTMYTKMKNISNNPNIQTSMIWGSLWDETLEWIIGTGDKARVEVSTNSISWGNYRGASFTYTDTSGTMTTKNADYGQLVPTGSTERNLANNIYDLAGNAYELTLERQSNVFCVCRGGWSQYYGDRDFASKRETYVTNGLMNRFYSYPENSNSTVGFRAYLYVK